MFDLFLGQGIFTTDGDQWKQHRGLAKPFFSRERISVGWNPLSRRASLICIVQDFRCFDLHAGKMLHVLALYANHDDPVDIQARTVCSVRIMPTHLGD